MTADGRHTLVQGAGDSVVDKKEASLSSLILLGKKTANNDHLITIMG